MTFLKRFSSNIILKKLFVILRGIIFLESINSVIFDGYSVIFSSKSSIHKSFLRFLDLLDFYKRLLIDLVSPQ